MVKYLFASLFCLPFSSFAQKVVHDWENYIVALNGKPVSINVDLGLKALAPIPEDSFVVILRVKLNQSDRNGMPKQEELELLLNMEDRLVEMLARQIGAQFAGRFTQRGIREFYFYAPDTLGYNRATNQAMQPFSSHEWLAQAKLDKPWDNFLQVLYPGELDMLRIQSRRKMEALPLGARSGREPVALIHFIDFATVDNMRKFLAAPEASGFELVSLPTVTDKSTGKYGLVLRRKESLGAGWQETVMVALHQQALKFGGKYKGWNPDQVK